MNITGSHRIDAPRARVWGALHDPDVLVRTLPGCEQLDAVGPDAYDAVLSAGVASIKGTYRARIELSEMRPPDSYRMHASGGGTPGTVSADVVVRLEDAGDATVVHYDAEAVVGGMIGGVGQRMLTGVARRTAGEFFGAVERELVAGDAATAADVGPEIGAAEMAGADTGDVDAPDRERADLRIGRHVRATASRPAEAERHGTELAGAAVLGGLIALAGVLVGRRFARGSRDG
jgi:uncharacterized protein